MEKRDLNKFVKLGVFFLGLFILFFGVSFAFINLTIFGSKQQVVNAGNLDLVLDEDENNLIIENALPMYDEVGMIQEAFTFRITNKTSMDTAYVLKLEEITVGESLAHEDVKYGLTKNKETTIDFVSNIVDNVIDEGIILGNETIEYKLRLWIRDTLEDEMLIQGKSMMFKLSLRMSQTEETTYRETLLNGCDPILSENLVPVTIQDDGTVQKANIYDEWYSYEDKLWANAVVLLDKTKTYSEYEIIPEENIESYFVWIPRFRYQIFNDTIYTGVTTLENRVQEIKVEFENKDIAKSNGTKKNEWLTHPAFTSFNSNGFWVGKFESGYKGATTVTEAEVNSSDSTKLQIKPDVYSWRSITVGNAFKVSYDYLRSDESHMMKNMEWGAVAYLQHSKYGSMKSVRTNNNNSYQTGYASVTEPTLGYNTNGTSISGNLNGTTADVTQTYNTPTGYMASTTGNVTGIYDMSGGSWEYVMGYNISANTVGGNSELTSIYGDFFTNSKWEKYYDKYSNAVADGSKYQTGLLGDATREMGPFGRVNDPDESTRYRMSWYEDMSYFVNPIAPWFARGGNWQGGVVSGTFVFGIFRGEVNTNISFRIVLSP